MKYEYGFIGYGVSNKAAVSFLVSEGIKNLFVSSDSRLSEEDRLFFHNNEIEYEEKGNSEKILNCRQILVSPGVNPSNPIITKAYDIGIPVMTDIDLADRYIGKNVKKIGVTGTNGKTTTVELTTAVLSSGFRTMSAGNIGISPAELINDKNIQFLVYELSSYQLHYLKNIRFDFGALLNVTEDHLAWHGNMKNYFDDKMRLSTISDNFAYNADSVCLEKDFDFLKIGKNKMEKCACHIDLGNKEYMINLRGDLKRIDYSGLKLLGEHNIYNAAFASLIGVYYGITEGAIEKSLEEFLPEEHRMEIFENYKDVEFVNDSKSTNADSLVNAIKTFHKKHNNLILLCGGRGKGEDYTILSQEIIGKVKKTYICGENSRELRTLLEGKCDFENFENWNSLIDSVFDNLEKNTTVLFSPGGSSFDFFENYKQRGEYFKKYVNSKLKSLNL